VAAADGVAGVDMGGSIEAVELVELRMGMASSAELGFVGEWFALGAALGGTLLAGERKPRGVDATLVMPGLDLMWEDSEAASSTVMAEEALVMEEDVFLGFGVLPSPILDFDLLRLTVSRSV
jgi:hypothetical protein